MQDELKEAKEELIRSINKCIPLLLKEMQDDRWSAGKKDKLKQDVDKLIGLLRIL